MAKHARRPPRRHEDEIFLKSILDHIPDMVFVKDAKDLRFVRFNKAGEKLLGIKLKDLIENTIVGHDRQVPFSVREGERYGQEYFVDD